MELTILKDIIIIFALSSLVNFVFTKFKIPTIIGYLITGIIAGPHCLKFIGASHEIEIMAEIGVVLLMFTIGIEFSIKHLIKIRRIVFLGGFFQLILTALAVYFVSKFYGLERNGAIFVGFLTALSSTAVVLKVLQEQSQLTSHFGRTVLGILIFQDIILVPLMLFTPLLGGEVAEIETELLLLLAKTAGIIAFVYVGYKWIMPKILHMVIITKNQELFMMLVLLICLSVAMATYSLGMSLAFGAFLGGLMISETEYSHNAFGHLIPFKDTFTSFFFVSIGMLLDLSFIFDNYMLVIQTVLIVFFVKSSIAGLVAFLLGHPFKSTILVGLALSQVGEFSFILAEVGVDYQILSHEMYQLFLAVTIVSMAVSPFLIQGSTKFADLLLELPIPKFIIHGLYPMQNIELDAIKNHIVLIGKDIRTHNLAIMARSSGIAYISVVFDPGDVQKRQKDNEQILYGDANSEAVLHKAYVHTANSVIISIGNIVTAMGVIEKVRKMNPKAYIIVRAASMEHIEDLYNQGADEVLPEEFETAVVLFERLLNKNKVAQDEVAKRISKIREDHYGVFRNKDAEKRVTVLDEISQIEVKAIKVCHNAYVIGHSLSELKLRTNFGVTLVAMKRGDSVIEHPDSDIRFEPNDVAYLLGKPRRLEAAFKLLAGS